MRRLEMLSNDGAALLIERETPDALWWHVTLNARGPLATTRVDPAGELFKTPIAEFFCDLAREWRGWSDEKTWESIDRTLRLNARHDGLGHIALRATLRESAYPDTWSLEATLTVDAGALDAIARDATSFSA